MIQTGNSRAKHRILVIGCAAGDECTGIPIANALSSSRPPDNVGLWIIPNLNPDGFARGERKNANGVDLNRNFPVGWKSASDDSRSENYRGKQPFSEPESRITRRLVEDVKPSITIWYFARKKPCRAEGVADAGGSAAIPRAYSRAVGLDDELIAGTNPGSAPTWQNETFPDTTAFFVELPCGTLRARGSRAPRPRRSSASCRLVGAARTSRVPTHLRHPPSCIPFRYRAWRSPPGTAAPFRRRPDLSVRVPLHGLQFLRARERRRRTVLRRLRRAARRCAEDAETRKVVTVVFTDVAGSTALGERLDPESLRRVMWRYFDAMQATLERHGGTVEKFIGDAVVAVFGVPAVHEDDALRAVRAAFEMREALERVNENLEREYGVRIATRTGVNTGEVIVGDDGRAIRSSRRATPSTSRRGSSRRRSRARCSSARRRTTSSGTRSSSSRRRCRGEGEEPAARRLAAARPAAGRAGVRAPDRHAVRRPPARARRAPPGVRDGGARVVRAGSRRSSGRPGSASRASRERSCARSSSEARVVVGRCVAYGEGITYLPLAEIVREVAGDDPEPALGELLADVERGDVATRLIAGAVGANDEPGSPEETAWAFRRLFEALAVSRPLVVVVDDIHWAEPTLLDLLEYVARLLERRADPAPLPRPPRPLRRAPVLGGTPAAHDARLARPARATTSPRTSIEGLLRRRRRCSGAPRPHRRRGRGQPAVRRADARHARRRSRGRGRRGAGDDPGAPRRPHRPARAG